MLYLFTELKGSKVMKSTIISALLMSVLMITGSVAIAGDFSLSGTQIAGSGHMKNARTESGRLVLSQAATITTVEGNAQEYCIWLAVTPQNRHARSVLCGGKGRGSIVGQTLSPGTYTVLPGLRPTIRLK